MGGGGVDSSDYVGHGGYDSKRFRKMANALSRSEEGGIITGELRGVERLFRLGGEVGISKKSGAFSKYRKFGRFKR